MARATWVQSNFNGGEWSPLAHGRFDLPKYRNSLALCLGFMPTQQGGLTRRPGTIYVADAKNAGPFQNAVPPRLVAFTFNLVQSYILEFGEYYVRFYVNDGQLQVHGSADPWLADHKYGLGALVSHDGWIYQSQADHVSTDSFFFDLSGGMWLVYFGSTDQPYEVGTPYSATEVWELDFTQKFDTLYITHPKYPVKKLQRVGSVNWVMNTVDFLDGPYLATNVTDTTLTPSGVTGTVTVTASSVTGINGGLGFVAGDAGRMLRLKSGGVWLSGKLGTPTDSTHIPWTVTSPNGQRVPATAKAIANVSSGSVFSITVTEGGSGYGIQPPSVLIFPHQPDPATATLVVSGGVVTGINVTHAGSGYRVDFARPYISIMIPGGVGTGFEGFALIDINGSVAGITIVNGGTGYQVTDPVEFVGGSAAGSGAIAYATLSDGVVTGITVSATGSGYSGGADVFIDNPGVLTPSTTTFWRLGEWNSVDGYPAHAVLHQDRLWLSGNAANPGKVNGSNTGDYENFSPSAVSGDVVDSHAVSFSLASGAIQWMVSDKQGLICGAEADEWVVAPSSAQQALTQTNVNTRLLGNFGSVNVKPIRVGNVLLFLQRTSRKLRELIYQFAYDTFVDSDVSLAAEHLTKSGIKQMAVQFAPQQIVWMVRTDGNLVAMTYDKEQDVNGWHRHLLGGYSDALKTKAPIVESVVCISAPDTRRDEVWLVVNRYANGAMKRTIERMAKPWEDGDAVADAFYLDCGATYSGVPATTITGLGWLIGQTVSVLADGGVVPDQVVDGAGTIKLKRPASKVQVGFSTISQGKTLRIEAGGADGPSQGKLKRVLWTIFRFFQTSRFDLWSETPGIGFEAKAFRDSNDPMDTPVALFDGDKRWTYDGTWASDGQIYFQASGPLPCNITLLMAQVDTKEMQ